MAIVTLVEYLRNNQLPVTIHLNDVSLRNVTIDFFEVSDKDLWLFTKEGHEMKVDISDFTLVDFDATVHKTFTSIEMVSQLRTLNEDIPYNAYVRNSKNQVIASFICIGGKC
ncbi:hypothetical protein [Halalkalibacter alkaliphilus]|uniref:Uncharacterized protein n=1 Tax=Halalkalibacter alkaliphilus TaxID=2917993 RepID=A0A9X2I6Q9_9BACI|nr:hypothetical protein [Halalkalibacter alkaliphilus]MCL7749032.1 hypothetical protein [Halalkalibacter alkaliphilus]